ncbi:hypothetical protein JCM9279_003466 [Rhodotorula babjevae]
MAADLAASFESLHVHAVYDEIAADFSRTRHSRWPFVERFFGRLPPGGLVLDAGTGNGKYLGCRSVLAWDGKAADSLARAPKGKGRAVEPADEVRDDEHRPPRSDLLPVGFDMSAGLLAIASAKGHEVVRGDCVDLSCWRRGAFNHAISIATIHHFATPARRVESVKQMILAVLPLSPPPSSSLSPPSGALAPAPPPSKLLIVVWSVEQDPALAARGGDRSARRTTGGKKGAVPVEAPLEGSQEASEGAAAPARGEGQDVFVPWERQAQVPRKREKGMPRERRPKGARAQPSDAVEGERASSAAALPPLEPPVEGASAAASGGPLESPSTPPLAATTAAADPKPSFNRYYHLFQQYELSALVARAALQLGLAFSAPAEYALGEIACDDGAGAPRDEVAQEQRARGCEEEAWEAFVELEEERWERENWVVEVAVGWRRRLGDSRGQTRA